MAIRMFSAKRVFQVSADGIATIVAGSSATIFPTVESTIDGWRLDGVSDAEWLAGEWFAEDNETDNSTTEDVEREDTIQGLVNATRKEREGNRGYTDEQESERLANLFAMVERGYAFERPIDSDDRFDDFDTQQQIEEFYPDC